MANIYLIAITGVSAIGNREQLSLNLPDEKLLTIQRTSITMTKLNQIRWNGNTGETASEARLLVSDEGVTGMIRSKNHNYDIHPFRDTGFHLLVEIDPSKFEHELPPLTLDDENEPENQKKAVPGLDPFQTMSNPEIQVMVVYTTNAKNNYSGSNTNMITLAEGNMSDAFTTSGVNADISVVHTAEISYSESSDATLNLCRLTMSETFDPREDYLSTACDEYSTGMIGGYMDQIHDWRHQHDAHLVVLITGSGGAGIAWMPASNNYAFSIARYDVAASFYTMAHETGHNLGAAHDTSNAGTPVYSYGHGYVYASAAWTTILSYPPSGFTRINRYSTPLRTFGGVATGTAQYEDNARAMNNRVRSVANFSPPPTPVSAYIEGDSYLLSYATGYWTATASGGSGSTYNFKWYVRPEYSSWSLARNETTSSNVDVFSMSAAASNFDIKVDVTRGSSEFYMEHPFLVYVCSEDPCMVKEIAKDGPAVPDVFSLEPGYPNPFNPTTSIPLGLPEASQVSLKVYNITGQLVATLASGQMSAGFHEVSWQADRFPSGMYILRMQAVGASGEAHQFVQKLTLLK